MANSLIELSKNLEKKYNFKENINCKTKQVIFIFNQLTELKTEKQKTVVQNQNNQKVSKYCINLCELALLKYNIILYVIFFINIKKSFMLFNLFKNEK